MLRHQSFPCRKELAVGQVSITVNGAEHILELEPRELLVYVLRERLGLTGTNVGCDTTTCGACTVLLDGRSVKSCTVLAVQADGREVTTIEGISSNGDLHPLQQAFHEQHALQCGYCTPGMVWVGVARSPFAHARINGVDLARVRERPGVVAAWSGDDLADEWAAALPCAWPVSTTSFPTPTDHDPRMPDHWPVAKDKARF